MKKNNFEKGSLSVLLFGLLFLSVMTTSMQANNFTINTDSYIGFKAKKLGFISVKRNFKDFNGSLKLDEADNIISLKGEVKIVSIFTNSKKRDVNILEFNFLYAELYPKSSFVMSRYEAIETNGKEKKGKAYGELTLCGVTQPIVLDSILILEKSGKTSKVALNLTGKINIKDFQIRGSKMNSDKIELHINTLWE